MIVSIQDWPARDSGQLVFTLLRRPCPRAAATLVRLCLRRIAFSQHPLDAILENNLVDRGREGRSGIAGEDVDRILGGFVAVMLHIGQDAALLVFLPLAPGFLKRLDMRRGQLDARAEQVFLGVVTADQALAMTSD